MSSPSCPYTVCSIAVGIRLLHFRFTLSHPVPVFRPRAGLPLADLTTWELLRYLVNNGWSDGKNSRAVPYVHDGVTHYFAKRVITVRGHHYYFLVLASAEVLFSRGVVSVHHHQPVDYYKCLLSLPAEHVVRGKAASHYEELLAKAVKSVKSRAAKKPRLDFLDDTVPANPLLPLHDGAGGPEPEPDEWEVEPLPDGLAILPGAPAPPRSPVHGGSSGSGGVRWKRGKRPSSSTSPSHTSPSSTTSGVGVRV
jgi:hypothetical protein